MMAVRLLNGVSFCEVACPIGAKQTDSDKKIPLLEGEPGAGHWLVHRGGRGRKHQQSLKQSLKQSQLNYRS